MAMMSPKYFIGSNTLISSGIEIRKYRVATVFYDGYNPIEIDIVIGL
jgi:hypothetical protein